MTETLQSTAAPLVYLCSAVSFFLGLKSLGRLRTASRGWPLLAAGILLAALGGAFEAGPVALAPTLALLAALAIGAGAGVLLGFGLPRAAVPSRVAFVPGLAGAAAALVAARLLPGELAGARLGGAIAAVVLGPLSALLGLALSLGRRDNARATAAAAVAVALAGGAAAGLGFALSNTLLIVVGGVAGTAGLALGRAVSAGAGPSLLSLLAGAQSRAERNGYRHVRTCGPDEVAVVLEQAASVLIIPGFGLALAQAQHAAKEMAELLEKRGIRTTWLLHPAAGRFPGHLNVVLDEAGVPHDRLVDLQHVGPHLAQADVALVLGGNDVVNPSAVDDARCRLWGMEVPDLRDVRSVFVVKRSLGPGAEKVRNPLFEQANVGLVLGDAKKVVQTLVAELKGARGH